MVRSIFVLMSIEGPRKLCFLISKVAIRGFGVAASFNISGSELARFWIKVSKSNTFSTLICSRPNKLCVRVFASSSLSWSVQSDNVTSAMRKAMSSSRPVRLSPRPSRCLSTSTAFPFGLMPSSSFFFLFSCARSALSVGCGEQSRQF